MMASSALLTRHASAMIRSAAAHGFAWSTISAAVQLTPEELQAERFDGNAFLRISREVKLLMSDEFCGFTAGRCPIGTFGEMCARAVTAPTIGEALQLAFEVYAERTREVRFELSRRGEIATVNVTVEHPEIGQHELLYEWWFLVWPSLASWLARELIPVVAVDLPHAPLGEPEEYAEAVSGVCRFRQPAARLLLPERHLHKPVLRESSEIPEFMSPRVDLRSGEHTFQQQLKQLLRQRLATTQSLMSIEDAAAYYHVSSQTLRRRLQAEWTSYRMVKEEVRRGAALSWLDHEGLSISEVSYRAGYAEPNGLTRALKSWAGISPSAYRSGTLM